MRFELTAIDIFLTAVYILIIRYVTYRIKIKKIDKFEYYKYFQNGLFVRIGASIVFSFIYLVYYQGGDTLYYFSGAGNIVKLFQKDIGAAIQVLFGDNSPEMRSLFDWQTGHPTYFNDYNSFSVCRFMAPFWALGFGSYWATTVLMNALLYIPIWNFYRMLCSLYPQNAKHMAYGLLFFPSLVFWGSGILKDVWCLSAVLMLYRLYWLIMIKKRITYKNILKVLFWIMILTSIRPFMFYTVAVTIIAWYTYNIARSIKNKIMRMLFFPMILGLMMGLGLLVISQMGSVAEGKYATVDSMLEQAVIIQDDLSRAAYGENSFDIGDFDASIGSMLYKAPQAIIAGIFRPFIWEARSLLMIFSGLESTYFIVFFLILIYRAGIIGFFRIIYNDPFLISSFLFAIIFAFFVGLTTANFGALVRYKIVLLPFINIVLFRTLAISKSSNAINVNQ